ncbi:MAG: FprA family A-type flavoprotein [Mogibacterium sp.]|nr:FprA family A-type flavoprotein [Mogibacterium sp.]
MFISDDVRYIGVNDHEIDLFEGQYVVPEGMAYNSYVILDEKIAVMDPVDKHFAEEWLANLAAEIGDRKPDYLVMQHIEPDHSSSVSAFMAAYPGTTVVASAQAFNMISNLYGDVVTEKLVVKEGDVLDLGSHKLNFVAAPMVHWPEVIVTYDSKDKILFSADAFGKFGALDAEDDDWACEARRYYFGIVGKFGVQAQNLLQKAAGLEIETICPLHGPILNENLGYYLDLYNTWTTYGVESEGIALCYTSVYGNTKNAVEYLAAKLEELGQEVHVSDLARDDMAEAVEDAFRYGTLILATTTYNSDIFPFMKDFIHHLVDHNYQNRKIAFVENGSWAPQAAKKMAALLEGCKDIEFAENKATIKGALNDESKAQLDVLAAELAK